MTPEKTIQTSGQSPGITHSLDSNTRVWCLVYWSWWPDPFLCIDSNPEQFSYWKIVRIWLNKNFVTLKKFANDKKLTRVITSLKTVSSSLITCIRSRSDSKRLKILIKKQQSNCCKRRSMPWRSLKLSLTWNLLNSNANLMQNCMYLAHLFILWIVK